MALIACVGSDAEAESGQAKASNYYPDDIFERSVSAIVFWAYSPVQAAQAKPQRDTASPVLPSFWYGNKWLTRWNMASRGRQAALSSRWLGPHSSETGVF